MRSEPRLFNHTILAVRRIGNTNVDSNPISGPLISQ